MKNRETQKIEKLFKKLCKQPPYKFPVKGYTEPLEVPSSHGVYIIYSPRSVVLHVGRTQRGRRGLRQRLNNRLLEQSSFVDKYLKGRGSVLRKGYRFKYLVVTDPRERALVEAFSIGKLCPEHLGLGE